MRRASPTVIVCAAIALLAGCGSSSSSTNSASTRSTTSVNTIGSGKKGSGLKATTTPKFASPTSSTPLQSGTVQIAYRNITIAPDTLRVKVGTTIKWTNHDAIDHNVTSQSGPQKFTSSDFGEKGTFEIKALKAGVIHYECTLHPASMNGTLEVVS